MESNYRVNELLSTGISPVKSQFQLRRRQFKFDYDIRLSWFGYIINKGSDNWLEDYACDLKHIASCAPLKAGYLPFSWC